MVSLALRQDPGVHSRVPAVVAINNLFFSETSGLLSS